MSDAPAPLPKVSARTRLLDAAVAVIREKGYTATTVDDLCAKAGVTKGAFFHHFKTKDDLAVAAAGYWGLTTAALFAGADYHAPADPLDRVLAYLDLRAALLAGSVAQYTCLAGTLVQETHETGPAIRDAAYACITGHAATLQPDFVATIALYGGPDCPSAASLALHTQTVLQGAFIQAKGSGDAAVAQDSIDHLRRYLKLLFAQSREERQ